MEEIGAEVVVYGGTPGGVIAAVAAGRRNANVVLIEQTRHVGGLNASGLNTAEREHMLEPSFSGLQLAFYRRVGRIYGHDVPQYRWESHRAEQAFREMLEEAGVTVLHEKRLAEGADTVETADGRIRAATLETGERVRGSVWIDATYEGDLMAAAGVGYAVGRESREAYDEPLAGQRFVESASEVAGYGGRAERDEVIPVSPYDEDGRLLPYFTPRDEIDLGAGDRKPMNYNFRITVSTGRDRVPIEAPPGYDPARFEAVRRWLRSEAARDLGLYDIVDFYPFPSGHYRRSGDAVEPVPGEKWELNNRQSAIFSLGHFGGQFGYPDGDAATRRAIWQDHREHNQGLLYFLAHDPDVPEAIRSEMGRYGLAADEFADHGHWPPYLYVREARRMIGRHVVTQHDVQRDRRKDESVTVGSHWIDSHHVQRVAVSRDGFRNEGRIWVRTEEPFEIPYGCVTPRGEECRNLLVPVCCSATHVGFCTLRLESSWMSLGHVAGAAATLALEGDTAVQEVDVPALRSALEAEGMITRLPGAAPG